MKRTVFAESDSVGIVRGRGWLEDATAWKLVKVARESSWLAPRKNEVQRKGYIGFSAAFGQVHRTRGGGRLSNLSPCFNARIVNNLSAQKKARCAATLTGPCTLRSFVRCNFIAAENKHNCQRSVSTTDNFDTVKKGRPNEES